MKRILNIIDEMEDDIDSIDVESIYHYYMVEFDGISNKVIISIVEAYEKYDTDTDINKTVEKSDIVEVISDISDNTFINMLIDYINRQEYNNYEGLIQFKGLALY